MSDKSSVILVTVTGGKKDKVQNFTFKQNTENYLSRIKPIADAQDKLQQNSRTISDSVAVWHKLEEDLSSAPIDFAKKIYHRQD